jgi:SOS-response transcriptional repressor LexA
MMNERIKSLRKELGLTQQDIASGVGVSKASVSQWESGSTEPKGENLHTLSKILKSNPEWLLYGKGSTESKSVAADPNAPARYPLVSWAQAGSPKVYPEDAEMYPCPMPCSKDTFVLRVQGASMEPVFRDGDLIFVDPASELQHAAYVVAKMVNGVDAIFKQLIIESGQKYLKPINPSWPGQILAVDDDCNIIGVVVFSGRSF